MKEPSTQGVETVCEVVVKETCNWAKIVEIRERKRVYDKAAAASVAKRLKEANPSLGEDVISPPVNDAVSVIDKTNERNQHTDVANDLGTYTLLLDLLHLSLTLTIADEDEVLEGVLSFLSGLICLSMS